MWEEIVVLKDDAEAHASLAHRAFVIDGWAYFKGVACLCCSVFPCPRIKFAALRLADDKAIVGQLAGIKGVK